MRPSLALTATAALVVAALAAPTSAASCNLITDPAGDAHVADPALDVLSADVASDKRDLTVAIRLADLGDTAATSPAGTDYELTMLLGETTLQFLAARAVGQPPVFRVRTRTSGGADGFLWFELAGPDVSDRVRGTFDTASDEVRITVPLADLARYGATRRGARAYDLLVRTWRTVPLVVDTVIASEDIARGTRSYALGTASCLAVGR